MTANTAPVLSAQKYDLLPGRTTLLVITTSGQFQYRLRSGTQTYTYDTAVAGDRYVLDGDTVSEIFLASGDTAAGEIHAGFNEAVAGNVVVQGTNGTPLAQDGGGTLLVISILSANLRDNQSIGPTSIAAATAETVEVAGAQTIAIGFPITYNGSMNGALATATDGLTYVALKGHLTAVYYVVLLAGPVADSSVVQTTTLEKVDIVARNQDTVAHVFSFNWSSGE